MHTSTFAAWTEKTKTLDWACLDTYSAAITMWKLLHEDADPYPNRCRKGDANLKFALALKSYLRPKLVERDTDVPKVRGVGGAQMQPCSLRGQCVRCGRCMQSVCAVRSVCAVSVCGAVGVCSQCAVRLVYAVSVCGAVGVCSQCVRCGRSVQSVCAVRSVCAVSVCGAVGVCGQVCADVTQGWRVRVV